MRDLSVINSDSVYAIYGICEPRIYNAIGENSLVPWTWAPDSLSIGHGVSLTEKMKTESFTVPAGGRMKYGLELFSRNPQLFSQPFSIYIQFNDVNTNQTIYTDAFPVACIPHDTARYVLYSIPLDSLAGSTVYMSVSLSCPDTANYVDVTERCLLNSGSEKGNQSRPQQTYATANMSLAQNYPNPVNPHTMIAFTLFNPLDVRLTVYDLLGRQVRILASGMMKEGYYSIPFDCSALPSGICTYVLESGQDKIAREMTVFK
jgi:hypothetical protein